MDNLLIRNRPERFGNLVRAQTADFAGIAGGVIAQAAAELGAIDIAKRA